MISMSKKSANAFVNRRNNTNVSDLHHMAFRSSQTCPDTILDIKVLHLGMTVSTRWSGPWLSPDLDQCRYLLLAVSPGDTKTNHHVCKTIKEFVVSLLISGMMITPQTQGGLKNKYWHHHLFNHWKHPVSCPKIERILDRTWFRRDLDGNQSDI